MTGKWPRLLVVDDDPMVARWTMLTLGRYFVKEGLLRVDGEIVDCRDGRTALRLLSEEGPFDLVLTDLMMNRMSGEELVARIRRGETESGTHATPSSVVVVAYSGGFAGVVDEPEPPFAEFDCGVNKPFEPEQLVLSLLKLLIPLDVDGVLTKNLRHDAEMGYVLPN